MQNRDTAIQATWFSLAGNVALAIIKAIAGITGNSYALIADAIESTTDIFSSLLVWLGLKYAGKPADEEHPYGHGRVEPLISFMVITFLVISAAVIIHESIKHIQTPHEVPEPWTLLVLGVIIIWKELSYRYVAKKGKQTGSQALQADAWHHRSDAITSITAFVGIAIAVWLGKGYETADDWAALVASVFILYNAYLLFRPAWGEMMDEQMHDELVSSIRHVALTVEGIKGTEKCFVRKAGFHYHVDLHALVDGQISVQEGHALAHVLERELRKQLLNIGHVNIHIEPEEYHRHPAK